jgi:hypothetical protein
MASLTYYNRIIATTIKSIDGNNTCFQYEPVVSVTIIIIIIIFTATFSAIIDHLIG